MTRRPLTAPSLTALDLADLLRHARERVGGSQADLALVAGLHRSTVIRWEAGEGLDAVLHYLRALELCGLEVVVRRPRRCRIRATPRIASAALAVPP